MFQALKINYNITHYQKIGNTKNITVKRGLETISYRTPQLWKLVPKEIKDAPTL